MPRFKIRWSQEVLEHGYSIVEANDIEEAFDKFREGIGDEVIENREIKDFSLIDFTEDK
ncbi:MAG: hypothetical protein J7K36_01255 [Archaeoglobaceae archaeon]|nr:hypothetical protein [Archaeoglobaceae archaeon]